MSTELTMLSWTVVLGIVQLLVVVLFFAGANGLPYAMGPRDDPAKPLPTVGARLQRASQNLMETFPFAAAAILIAAVLNRHNSYTVLGSELYFWGRLIYVPVYAAGIPGLRTVVWLVSLIGIVLVLAGLM